MAEVGFHLCCGEGDDVQGNAQTRRLRFEKQAKIHDLKKSDNPADIEYAATLQNEIDSEVKVMQSYIYIQVAGVICCVVIPLTFIGVLFATAG